MEITMELLYIIGYAIPATLCLIHTFFLIRKQYREDIKTRQGIEDGTISGFYRPTLHVSDILAEVAVSLVPLVNIVVTLFLVLPEFIKPLIKSMNVPLVPRRDKK